LLIVVYAVIAMLAFSKDYHYEKSIVINAPKKSMAACRFLKGYNTWDPFSKEIKNSPLPIRRRG
jgi:hypothetical protein